MGTGDLQRSLRAAGRLAFSGGQVVRFRGAARFERCDLATAHRRHFRGAYRRGLCHSKRSRRYKGEGAIQEQARAAAALFGVAGVALRRLVKKYSKLVQY
jgi:hypothetical protein